jgi:N-methylhydantoinase B
MLREYGRETVDAAIHELMERAEAATRQHIAAIPDGTYSFSDYLDNDGVALEKPVKICVAVTIKGSDVLFDFTGSSTQVSGPVNSVTAATMSGAYYVLRVLSDPSIPNNGGCYRMATFKYPEGSVVNPVYPAPVNARALTIARIADAIRGALIKALPDRLIAADSGHLTIAFGGLNPRTRRPFVTSEMGAGGAGARKTKDGIDVIDFGAVNCMNIPVEAIEMDSPIRIEKFKIRDDSGGPGRQRGGLGAEKIFGVRSGPIAVTVRGERFFTQPWGVFGGQAGGAASAWVERRDGSRQDIRSKCILTLNEGDRLFFQTPGGGGYGDPLERDPELVCVDVADRKVSAASARELYGVVLADGAVDHEQTKRLRADMAAKLKTNFSFDHGRLGKSMDGDVSIGSPAAAR